MSYEKILSKLTIYNSRASWATMQQKERALAVAHDIITLLDCGYLHPMAGCYVSAKRTSITQSVLDSLLAPECYVCVKGAAIVALYIGLNNDPSQFGLRNAVGFDIRIVDYSQMNFVLIEVFGRVTAGSMEQAFEHTESGWRGYIPDSRLRLRTIVQQFINNGGEFSSIDTNKPPNPTED